MLSFKDYLTEKKIPKASGDLKDACWTGYTAVGMKMKNGRKVPNCVPEETVVTEADKLQGTPVVSLSDFNDKDDKKNKYGQTVPKKLKNNDPRVKFHKDQKQGVTEELSADEQFNLIEEMIMDIAEQHNIDPELIWEKIETVDDVELLEYAVDAKGHKSSTGGLTQKGRDAYNAKGANLKAPVTTPPSKLKPGSKAANRRKSFCARMGGMEGPMKKPNGEPTRKALALRKWNC